MKRADVDFQILKNIDDNEPISIVVENENAEECEEDDSILENFRQPVIESVSVPPLFTDDCIEIAPGEGKIPENIGLDSHCEELAFPHLLPDGKFGYKISRNML